jgi:hypothetical protein
MSKQVDWAPKLKDWSKLNTEAYKVIYEQSKERFEAHACTSEEISKRAQTLAFGLFAFLGAFISLKPQLKIPIQWAVLMSILLLTSLVFIAILLSPKEMMLRGSPPKEMLFDGFDEGDWSTEEQLNLVYYNEIRRYQHKINQIKTSISCRLTYYKLAFGSVFLILLILCGLLLPKVSHL